MTDLPSRERSHGPLTWQPGERNPNLDGLAEGVLKQVGRFAIIRTITDEQGPVRPAIEHTIWDDLDEAQQNALADRDGTLSAIEALLERRDDPDCLAYAAMLQYWLQEEQLREGRMGPPEEEIRAWDRMLGAVPGESEQPDEVFLQSPVSNFVLTCMGDLGDMAGALDTHGAAGDAQYEFAARLNERQDWVELFDAH
ncbi:MAG TPA: hypothetical protein VGS28_00115 [Candidatus Saccharimonadales bacterium]|nr:hypothetical protein [Candidatus Saccharimonadales bacterium]